MKDHSHTHYFLGFLITCDESTITITETIYLLSIFQKFGLDGTKPMSTPLALGISMSATNGTPLANPTLYHHLVGSL